MYYTKEELNLIYLKEYYNILNYARSKVSGYSEDLVQGFYVKWTSARVENRGGSAVPILVSSFRNYVRDYIKIDAKRKILMSDFVRTLDKVTYGVNTTQMDTLKWSDGLKDSYSQVLVELCRSDELKEVAAKLDMSLGYVKFVKATLKREFLEQVGG